MPGLIELARDDFDAGIPVALLLRRIGRRQRDKPGRDLARLGNQASGEGDPQLPVEHDPHRRTLAETGEAAGQLRIVGQHGAGADQDRVMRRAQQMGVLAGRRAGDPAAFAGSGGDAAVEAQWPVSGSRAGRPAAALEERGV